MAYAFGWGHGMGFGFGFLNFLGTLLFILLLVWAIRMVASGGRAAPWRGGMRRARSAGDEAMRAARERFAQGEIDAEQFAALRSGLEADGGGEGGSPLGSWFDGRDSALELARLRFARGEITLEELEVIRKGLAA